MFVTSNAGLLDLVNAAIVNEFLMALGHCTVKLAKAPMTPTVNSVPADFTEADYTGYAAIQLDTLGVAHIDKNSQAAAAFTDLAIFVATGTITPVQNIYGYWLIDSANNYIGAEAFGTPFPMSGPLSPLQLQLGFAMRSGILQAVIVP